MPVLQSHKLPQLSSKAIVISMQPTENRESAINTYLLGIKSEAEIELCGEVVTDNHLETSS